MTRVDTGVTRSLEVLRACTTPHGFVASSRFDHYRSIWVRDACITGLGALVSGEDELIDCVTATIETLVRTMSPLGHVPAVVRPESGEWDWAEGGVVDTNAWFVILVGRHLATTRDTELAEHWWPAVERSMAWLAHQDVTGSGLISVAPSTDWMDAALTRSGRTLHLNVLYAWAAREAAIVAEMLGRDELIDPTELARIVNAWFWPDASIDMRTLYPHGFGHDALRIAYWEAASPNRVHYVSHIVHAGLIDGVDVLANLLAVEAGVAVGERAERILDLLFDASTPYPTPSLLEPIQPGDPSAMLVSVAEASIPSRWRNRPGWYHNGGIWPYIGGFQVAAEVRLGRRARAMRVLNGLAAANALADWSFPEWIDGAGEPQGAEGQAWNAGMYLYAYRRVHALG